MTGGGLSSSAGRDSGDRETGHTEIDEILILTTIMIVNFF